MIFQLFLIVHKNFVHGEEHQRRSFSYDKQHRYCPVCTGTENICALHPIGVDVILDILEWRHDELRAGRRMRLRVELSAHKQKSLLSNNGKGTMNALSMHEFLDSYCIRIRAQATQMHAKI